MKNKLLSFIWIELALILGIIPAIAQQLSTNQVNYQLTYNSANQTYTVWVVPQYATPNANNPNTNEFGGTAQVSLKVPKDFVIQNITDIKGTWEKSPVKLGAQPVFTPAGLDPNYLYYVIGKNSTEVDYGPFASGTPVSLFTFQGNACFGAIGILAKADPFVAAARSVLSLNTACSFYSRSGQAISGNVTPLEQFVEKLGPDVDCSAPAIKVIKSISSVTSAGAAGALDDVINYSFTVTNTGNVTLSAVSLTDAKLNLTNAAVNPAILLPGGTGTATATYIITQNDVNGGGVENTATVIGTPSSGPVATVTDVSDAGTNNTGQTITNPDVTESPKLNGTTDADPTNDPTVLLITPTPSIKVVKSVASVTSAGAAGSLDDVINYTFAVTNTGNVPLTAVAISDPLLGTNLTGGPISLAVGGSDATTFKGTYTITQTDINAGGVQNTATATGTPPNLPNGNPATPVTDVSDAGTNNTGQTITNPDVTESPKLNGTTDADPTNDPTVLLITPTPSIKVVKSVASVTSAGAAGSLDDVINYTFAVTNTGNVTLTGVALTDTKLSLSNAAVNPATLLPGATGTATATYTITQADVNAGGIENTATVTGTPPNLPNGNPATPVTDISDAGTDNNAVAITNPDVTESPKLNGTTDADPTNDPTVLLITADPRVKLVKTAAVVGTGAVGDGVNYTFTVTNTGNVTLTNSRIDDAKLGLTGLVVTPSTLAPGEVGTATAPYTITQADLNAGEIKNTAVVICAPPIGIDIIDISDSGDELVDTPADPDTDPTNDPTVVPLTQNPKIGIAKVVTSFVDNLNYTFDVTFSIKVKNLGNVPLSNIQVFDTLSKTFPSPATTNVIGLSSTKFTVSTAYTGTASNTQLLLPNNSLAISDSGSISLTVRVSPNILVGVTYSNIAYTTGQSPLGQIVKDQSQLGNEPDPDFDLDPKNNSDPTPITILPPGKLTLLPKVYLQGSLFGVFSGNLMRDDLRAKNLIPRKSPYVAWNPITAADTITSNTVLGVTGADAIVDWVFVELRDANDSTIVVDSRSALLQRDGDIVEIDGTSPITFNTIAPANYFVSVRHRNHLGVMSKTAIPLTQVVSTIDFRSSATPTYVLANSPIHQSQVDVVQGKALWAGNALYDGQVVYQGTDNDVNVVYQQVIASAGNPFLLPFYILPGYYTGDINMDGDVIFQGTTNDLEYIYQNVINNHSGNALKQSFFIIQQQLPK
jgi:large repetitive protein